MKKAYTAKYPSPVFFSFATIGMTPMSASATHPPALYPQEALCNCDKAVRINSKHSHSRAIYVPLVLLLRAKGVGDEKR